MSAPAPSPARIVALSWDGTTPQRLARELVSRGLGRSRLVVLEAMGGPAERMIDTTAETFEADAIAALNEGRCEIAGFHAPPQPGRDSLARRTYQPLLKPGRHKLIGFARRSQGLLVAPGNPLGLATLADVARSGARWANRSLGTGTRLLLDELMGQAGLKPGSLRGWDHAEPSHSAVAQAVASGAADAGLGIEAAARARGLDFVPLVEEDYYLVCLKSALAQPACDALRQTLRSPAWLARLAALPDTGYYVSRSRAGDHLVVDAGPHGFANGVHANASISQVAAGWKCDLYVGIYGTKGSVQWSLQQPNEILVGRRDGAIAGGDPRCTGAR